MARRSSTKEHWRASAEDGIVHELVTLIQKSGDKILAGNTKLVLTLSVLNCVNRKLGKLRASADVDESVSSSAGRHDDIVLLSPGLINSNDNIWHGLECRNAQDELVLLQDFLKRLSIVKITQGFGTVQGSVDISHFSPSLRVLELKRVPIHLLVGLQSLRPHLKLISCSHCLQNLEDLFSTCGGDRSSPFAWPELLSARLSYNSIYTIDSSLRLLPSLVSLDLSHNQISDTSGLEYLTDLQYLNLSYNQLKHLPVLGSRAKIRLRILSMRNNCLESLESLAAFPNLQQVDLAFNCLLNHCTLAPCLCLPHIVLICLDGNPISFHDKHRLLTGEHLHQRSLLMNCNVDGKSLTNIECAAVDKFGSGCRTWKHVSTKTNGNTELPQTQSTQLQTLVSSRNIESAISDVLSEDIKKSKRKSRRNPLIREVSIEEASSTSSREIRPDFQIVNEHKENIESEHFEQTSADQNESMLTARNEIERFRQQHGKEWLIIGSKMNVLTPVTFDTNDQMIGGPSTSVETTVIDVNMPPNTDERIERQHRQSQVSDDVIVLDPFNRTEEVNMSTDANGRPDQFSKKQDDVEVPWRRKVSQDDVSADEDGDDAVLPPFIVQMEKPGVDSSTTILVVISDRDLREKDALTGRTIERLDLRSICSIESLCPTISGKLGTECEYPRLKIGFSYVRRDRRERIYTMEDAESHKQFLSLLKPIVDAKTLEEVTSGALQCLKCSAQFSKDVAKRVLRKTRRPQTNDGVPLSSSLDEDFKGYPSEANACPNCSSEMIVELHESAQYPNKRDLNYESSLNFPFNAGYGMQQRTAWDIGSLTRSLVGTTQADHNVKMHRSRRSSFCNIVHVEVEVHADRYQSNDDNSANYQRISSSLPFMLRRSGSDITILSNPSQSSIMVVANPSVDVANLDAISETNSDNSRLIFESHSSGTNSNGEELKRTQQPIKGSPTSSACTALEKSIYDCNPHCTPAERLVSSQSFKECNSSSTSLSSKDGSSEQTKTSASSERLVIGDDQSFRAISSPQDVRAPEPSSKQNIFIEKCQNNLSVSQTKITTWSCRDAQIEYSFSDFGHIDHRLRLYLDMHILVDSEEVVAVLRTAIVPYDVKDADGEFQGLLIVSRSTVYILRVTAKETCSDQPHDWLEKYDSKPLVSLMHLNIRLGNQAIQLEFGPKAIATCYTLLLRDADHCNNFINFFQENLQIELETSDGPFECGLDSEETLQIIREHLLPWKSKETSFNDEDSHEDVPIILYLMCYRKQPDNDLFEPISLAMTPTCMYVFSEDLHWPMPHLILPPNDVLCRPQLIPMDKRSIHDLTSVELSEENQFLLSLTFLDENTQEEYSLQIVSETKSSSLSIVQALKEPWEKLFGVELQFNVAKNLPAPM